MTTSARTVETNFADALAEFFANVGDTDNAEPWVKRLEGSFPSPIRDVYAPVYIGDGNTVVVEFEDGSVLHLSVTQSKEPTPVPINPQWNGPIRASELGDRR